MRPSCFGGPPPNRPSSLLRRWGRWWLLPEHRVREERRFRRRILELARQESFDVIHCHDYPTLAAGLELAAGAPVIYDSHECWNGRLRHGRPEPIRRKRQLRDEARMARRAAAVVTVSDELADWLAAHLHVPRPLVVRNTFIPPADDEAPLDEPTGIVYAGRIGPGRDLETAMRARMPDGVPLILAGPMPADHPSLAGTRYEGVRSVQDVPGLLTRHGLALVSLDDSCLNHRLALPNKLFQAVASGVPVVASDLPAIRRIVDEHGIGTLYRPGDARSLGDAVQAAVAAYAELRDNVEAARNELSWKTDGARLRELYRTLTP